MNDVVTRGPLKLPRTKWPQDTLRVPEGYGRMPLIGARNDLLVGQEYFCNSGTVQIPAFNQAQIILNMPVGNDGDFWLTNICVVTVTGNVIDQGNDIVVSLTDSLTGYNVFSPYIHVNTLFTPLQGSRINWNEPYCFPRRSSMLFGITRLSLVNFNSDIYIACQGWKEYSNAVQ